MRTIIDLREDDELSAPDDGAAQRDGVETIHIPLDRIADDPEFWEDWMHGPQFGTPLYYGPFLERFPERIEQVLDAIERARPGGVLFHCVGGRDRTGLVAIAALGAVGVAPETIADDYARGAERAHTYEPVLEEYLAERGTSARELVLELGGAASTSTDRRFAPGSLLSMRAWVRRRGDRGVRGWGFAASRCSSSCASPSAPWPSRMRPTPPRRRSATNRR